MRDIVNLRNIMNEAKTQLVSAILMAAGKSERMGQNKLLLPFGGRTVIQRTLDSLIASRAGEVIVVLGSKAQEIGESIGARRALTVTNPDFANGMSTSLIAGLGKVSSQARFVMVALGDQPLVTAAVYNRLIEAALNTENGLILPVYRGERGNPIIISMRYRAEILKQTGDVGGRELLNAHPCDVLEVPVDCEGVIINMNTREEYEKRLKEL
jgi:molybdenum cofactor cytidylyltransferase